MESILILHHQTFEKNTLAPPGLRKKYPSPVRIQLLIHLCLIVKEHVFPV